jgi:WD40 repeat protein
VETGQELVNNPWHKERVSALLFPKKGDLAITTSWDGRITVWDLATRTPSRSVEDHHAGVWVARFRDDERYLVTGDEEGTLAIRDGETLEVRHFIRVPATSHATQAWFTPRGDTLVTVAADGSLREWHAASGQPLLTVDAVAHGKVFDATFSPSTGLLATASLRATDLWRIGPSADYRLLGVAEIGPTALGPGEVSADGRRLIAPRKGSDGKFSVRTWDTTSGRLIADWAENATPHSVAVSRNGDRVAVATLDGAPPRLWDGQGRLVAMLEGHERLVYNLAISPDDRLVATASYDRSVRIWRAKDGGPERIIRMELRPTAVAFDPSGPRLAVVDEDGRLSFYDRETGELLERFAAHPTWVQDVEYSRDGTKVVTAGRQDHTAKIWDLAEGRPPILLAGHADNLMRASFSPDGRVVATSSVDDTARIWDTETGELLRTLPGPSTTAAFGPDGHVLYTTGSKDYAVAWELRLDGRSAEELARAVTEGSPWRLENARLTLSEE